MAHIAGINDQEGGLAACTIVTANNIRPARVLADSFRNVYPDHPFYVLVVDSVQPVIEAPIRQLALKDLPTKLELLQLMALIYDEEELVKALKPHLLLALLERHPTVVYLDPDTRLYAPMDELRYLGQDADVLLAPHDVLPLPEDSLRPSSTKILRSGMYDLGFVALNAAARPLLKWWSDRMGFDTTVGPFDDHFSEQRWMDFAPAFARARIVHHPGYGVAYWNLHTRFLENRQDGYRVNGLELVFAHFQGYDPDRPHIVSSNQGEFPRVLFSERQDVLELFSDCREEILSIPEGPAVPYGFSASARVCH